MKTVPTLCLLAGFVCLASVQAEVTLKQLDDRVRVEVDGKLFTEYRYEEWYAPYLFPVVGPNGETVTRHFPIEDARPGEQTDHEHHRSIRFSHRRVNGYSFWAPQAKEGGNLTEIKLNRIEKATSGEKAELILWNDWLANGELELTEKLRLVFHDAGNGQRIIDYDVELHAGEKPVLFGDQKDGGLGVRVAGTMKVEDRKTKEGKGTIVNSKGLKNQEAWGKRAEWADYSGPDASGKIVGIAIFDHPSNLRFPTWWHARTYGLITANRFGQGQFEKAQGVELGAGDYTMKPGEVMKLRHRIYIHHGGAEEAKVAEQYAKYIAEDSPGT